MTAQQTFRNTVIVVVTLALAYAITQSIGILIVLLIAIIIASAIRPAVLFLKNHHVPEGLAILLVYALLAFALFLLGAVVLPPAMTQLVGYVSDNDALATKIIDAQTQIHDAIKDSTGTDLTLLDPALIKSTISNTVDAIKKALPAIAGEFGGLAGNFVLILVMGVYWLTSRDQAVDFVLHLFPLGRRGDVGTMIHEIESSMGAYVRGIVLISTFVGVANFIILSIFQVPNPVTLGFIVGITTALPIIGGYIGAFTATLLAFLSSPLNALIAFGTFVVVQQVENHLLTPRVMSRSVNLNPILIIVFLFVGSALGGVIGALIAVPIAGTLNILLRHLIIEPRQVVSAPQYVDGGILLPGASNTEQNTPPPSQSQDIMRSANPTS